MSQEQCLHLAREMRTVTSLVTLSLGSNSRRVLVSSSNPEVYTALGSLAHLPRLRDVALFGLGLPDAAIMALSAELLRCASPAGLETVFLPKNNIGPEGMRHLASALRDIDAIRGCKGGGEASPEVGIPISSLILGGNALGDEGCAYAAQIVQRARELTALDLSANHLSASGCGALSAALLGPRRLALLDLHGNEGIGDEGVKRLVGVLKAHASLCELNLAGCNAGDSSAVALASVLSCLISLQRIDLSDNNIQDRGCQALAENLGDFPPSSSTTSSPCFSASSALITAYTPTRSQEPAGTASVLLRASVCGRGTESGIGDDRGSEAGGGGGSAGTGFKDDGGVSGGRRGQGGRADASVCPVLRELDLQRNPRISIQGHRALKRVAAARPLQVVLSFQFNFPGESA
jgi:hypothetical protein